VADHLKKEVNQLTSKIDQLEQELAQATGTPAPANSIRYYRYTALPRSGYTLTTHTPWMPRHYWIASNSPVQT